MKKSIKIILIVIGFIILLVGLDVGSILLWNKPLFAIKEDQTYRGLLYDTYNCIEYPMSQIKTKWSNFSCAQNTNDYIYGKITQIDNDYIVVTITKDNLSIKVNDEAYISLSNNPKLNGSNNLIIGQNIKIQPKTIQETYPIMIITNTIDVINN